jgi:stage II sporulation protein P
MINGKTAAQIMFVAGVENSAFSFPNWRDNLSYTARLQHTIASRYQNLVRPMMLCYRSYNMHLTTGSMLVEIGTDGNTLSEAMYSAELFAKGLAEFLLAQE